MGEPCGRRRTRILLRAASMRAPGAALAIAERLRQSVETESEVPGHGPDREMAPPQGSLVVDQLSRGPVVPSAGAVVETGSGRSKPSGTPWSKASNTGGACRLDGCERSTLAPVNVAPRKLTLPPVNAELPKSTSPAENAAR